jgi:hypothetical protein
LERWLPSARAGDGFHFDLLRWWIWNKNFFGRTSINQNSCTPAAK